MVNYTVSQEFLRRFGTREKARALQVAIGVLANRTFDPNFKIEDHRNIFRWEGGVYVRNREVTIKDGIITMGLHGFDGQREEFAVLFAIQSIERGEQDALIEEIVSDPDKYLMDMGDPLNAMFSNLRNSS